MKYSEFEQKIRNAFKAVTPDDFGAILSDCENKKGTVIVMTEKRRPNYFKKIAAIAAAIVLVATVALSLHLYNGNRAEMASVSMEVNPGIEISINRKERVLEVIPLNDDGKTVIGDMDLSGSDLDVAVNALVGSMLKNGFITENANSMLISVDGKNAEKNEKIRIRLTEDIAALIGDDFDSAILAQELDHDAKTEALAKQYGISEGKAQYIQRIVAANNTHTFEELVGLSINELNLISENKATKPEKVETVGKASDNKYIGRDKALATVLALHNIKESAVTDLSVDMDYENGVMVYEIDFDYNGKEYEYDVNALTAKILNQENEIDDDFRGNDDRDGNKVTTSSKETPATSGATQSSATAQITKAKAKSIAFSNAGVKEANVYDLEVELDRDDGVLSWEIEFNSAGREYKYDINAKTGKILKAEKDYDDDYKPTQSSKVSSTTSKATSSITGAKAQSIAFNHAGVKKANVYDLETELDTDDGVKSWEIEFKSDNVEYKYDIKASDGKILKSEKDIDD